MKLLLTSDKSLIKFSLECPIHLDKDKKYMLLLAEFYTDNFITNIDQDLITSNAECIIYWTDSLISGGNNNKIMFCGILTE